eukprot:scaffold3576_cov170-Amphora_coffeaeformis.AAC.4
MESPWSAALSPPANHGETSRPASSDVINATADQSIEPRPLAWDAKNRSCSRDANGMGVCTLAATSRTNVTSLRPKSN